MNFKSASHSPGTPHYASHYILTPRRQAVWDGLEPEYRTLMEEAAGHTLPGEGDREDTLEELARLMAAIRAVPACRLWIENEREDWGTTVMGAVNWTTGEEVGPGDTMVMRSIGSVPNLHNNATYGMDPRFATARFIDSYYDSPVFQKHAGRPVVCTTLGEDDGRFPDLASVLNELPGPKAFIKATQSKLATFSTPVPMDTSDLYTQVPMNALDSPGGLLVQPHVTMRYEYRVFVIGHRVVTAAGNIEHHTPFDNTEQLNPVMEHTRGDGNPVAVPKVRAKHLMKADEFTREWAETHTAHCMYVLDLAIGPDGESLVVELNSLNNAGLFACNEVALFREWVDHLDRQISEPGSGSYHVHGRHCGGTTQH